MLKKTDFLYIGLSFLALLSLYLVMEGSITMNTGQYDFLEPLSFPKDYSVAEEYQAEDAEFAVLCGKQKESRKTREIIEMLSNLKIKYHVFSKAEQINSRQAEHLTTVVITAKSWDEIGNKDLLFQYAVEDGKNLLFTDILKDEDGKYNKKTGILENRKQVQIEGIMIFEELLVQGMVYYDDMECSVSDVRLDARCKKLMVERTKQEKEQRDLIPLVWQKRDGNGCYYVVNGNFLSAQSGMGILTGLLSQMQEDFIYPVVNAKVCLLDSFPELDNPYEKEIKELYSRDTNMFIRDIMWPSIVKLGEANHLIFTTRLNKPVSEENVISYEYLKKMMKKWQYEMDTGAGEDLELTYICAGHRRNSTDTFRMQSSVSGAGLAAQYLDMSEVMGKNADNPQYEWSKYSLELSKKMSALYQDMDWVDGLPFSQAKERYKRYLLISPEIRRKEAEIEITTSQFHDICFYIIRTDKRVLEGEGYETERIGENAYLIKVYSDRVTLSLEEKEE